MNRMTTIIIVTLCLLSTLSYAETNLSTQIEPSATSMVLYRNASLSLVQQEQQISLIKGMNQLQFTWSGSSIDPTSLMLSPREKGASIVGLSFAPNSQGSALWQIESKISAEATFALSYLSTGLTASTSYRLVLNEKGDRAELQGTLYLHNRSREPFENLRLSLLVGSIQVLDDLATLASRHEPYGRPSEHDQVASYLPRSPAKEKKMMVARTAMAESFTDAPMSLKQTQAVSDYAFIPIPARRTIKAGWGEVSPMINTKSAKVINRFCYDEDRYGTQTTHLLDLVNSKENGLGLGPLPDGEYTIYQKSGESPFYQSKVSQGFIPMGGAMELNLGSVDQVQVVVKEIDLRTFDHQFDKRRTIGWRETRQYQVTIVNNQSVPADMEIIRRMQGSNWRVEHDGFDGDSGGTFTQIDQYRGAYRLTQPPMSKRVFGYTVTSEMGSLGLK